MKKIMLFLCLLFAASLAWAGDVQLTEENFMSWVKAQKIDGFQVDEESLENYDDREFSIDFISTGDPSYLSIQIEGSGALEEIKTAFQNKSKDLDEFTEVDINGNKAAYYTLSAFKEASFMNMDLPQIGGELRLTTSPKKSLDEMKALVSKFNLQGLK